MGQSRSLSGEVSTRDWADDARFTVKDASGSILDESSWGQGEEIGHEDSLMHLIAWLREHQEGRKLVAIGHRVVHGGATYFRPGAGRRNRPPGA